MNNNPVNIDAETILALGLTLSDKEVNSPLSASARVFEYPGLADVFVMESDLYGNEMPMGSIFLAFSGSHGLMGKHLTIKTLQSSSAADLKKIMQENVEG